MMVPLLFLMISTPAASLCLTTQGLEGPHGPTSWVHRYAGVLTSVELVNGYQKWVVPESGVYRLEAYGAASYPQAPCHGFVGNTSYGRGAIMRGHFTLNAGDILWMLVGQRPVQSTYNGGAGGTFVASGSSFGSASPLLVAGGAGSYRCRVGTGDDSTLHAVTDINGVEGGFGSAGQDGLGATGCSEGGGGAGFFGDGCQNTDPRNQGASVSPARSFVNGGTGGTFSRLGTHFDGGFGGGGMGGWGGAGGGGGYSGGSPADNVNHPYSGGGGSFNTGANRDNTPGSAGGNDGPGMVCVTKTGTINHTMTIPPLCRVGEELAGEVCVACPAGTHSEGGSTACLPLLGHFLMSMQTPQLHLQGDGFGVVHLRLNISELPALLYGGVTPRYTVDIASTEKDLVPDSACNAWWAHAPAEIRAQMTFGDLSGACDLSTEVTEEGMIMMRGLVALFLHANQTVLSWRFAITLNLSQVTASTYNPIYALGVGFPTEHDTNLGHLNSTLQLYASESFAAIFTVGLAVYRNSERLYAQHSLDSPEEGLDLTVSLLWLSRSADPAAQVHENLTASVQEVDSRRAGAVRFSAELEGVCEACYLHVLSTIIVRDRGRRLGVTAFHHADRSIPISVLAAEPRDSDNVDPSLRTLVVGAEVSLSLASAIAVVLGLLTRLLLSKLAPTAENVNYRAFFVLEFADIVLDVVAYVLCRGGGDLDFENDTRRVVSTTLLASVALSAALCIAEMTLFLRRKSRFQQLFWWLMCAHLIVEDFFQCALYSIVAASQAATGVGYETAVVFGFLQSGLFICLKIWEIIRSSSRN